MTSITLRIAAGLAALALAGCASVATDQAMLTYETVPEGAQLFEAGKPLGAEPVTRTYKAEGAAKIITTPDVTAIWPSGAKVSFFTHLEVGADRVAKLQRPSNAPGLQLDVDNAKSVLATRLREAERVKSTQLSDVARSSARCKAQQSGNAPIAGTDDCK